MKTTYNLETISTIIQMFMSLNVDRQAKAYSQIYTLCLEQKAEEELKIKHEKEKKTSKNALEEEIKDTVSERKKKIVDILKLMDQMDETQKAALVMEMETLLPGSFTKSEDVSLTINSKTIPLEQYLKTVFPKVNLDEAKTLLKKLEDN